MTDPAASSNMTVSEPTGAKDDFGAAIDRLASSTALGSCADPQCPARTQLDEAWAELRLSAEIGQTLLKEQKVLQETVAQRDDSISQLKDEAAVQAQEKAKMDRLLANVLEDVDRLETLNRTSDAQLRQAEHRAGKISVLEAHQLATESRLKSATKDVRDLRQELAMERRKASAAELRANKAADRVVDLERKLATALQSVAVEAPLRTRATSPHLAPVSDNATKEPLLALVQRLSEENDGLRSEMDSLQEHLRASREEQAALAARLDDQRAFQPDPDYMAFEQPASASLLSEVLMQPQSPPASLLQSSGRSWTTGSNIFSHVPASVTSATTNGDPTHAQQHTHYHYHLSETPTPSQHRLAGSSVDSPAPPQLRRPSFDLKTPCAVNASTQTDSTGNCDTFTCDVSPSGPVSSDQQSEHSLDRDDPLLAADVVCTATLPELIGDVNSLLNRLQGANVSALQQRLARQRLAGDVKHLATATLRDISNDVESIRKRFQRLLADERLPDQLPPSAITSIARRELRNLVKLFRDLLMELVKLRGLLNSIRLEPHLAEQISRSEGPVPLLPASGVQQNHSAGPAAYVPQLLAPFSRLLSTAGIGTPGRDSTGSGEIGSKVTTYLRVPKRATSTQVTSATVAVEFGQGGIRRAVSTAPRGQTGNPSQQSDLVPSRSEISEELQSLFAGTRSQQQKPWVIVGGGGARSSNRRSIYSRNQLTQQTNAVLDLLPHAPDQDAANNNEFHETLLQRTLRPRGLSDSSIRSTFLQHESPARRMLKPTAGGAKPCTDQRAASAATARTIQRDAVRELSATMQPRSCKPEPRKPIAPPGSTRASSSSQGLSRFA